MANASGKMVMRSAAALATLCLCVALASPGSCERLDNGVLQIPNNYFGHHRSDLLDRLFETVPNGRNERLDARSELRFPLPGAGLSSAPYAEWAHHHWVWLSNERATQASMSEYAREYLNRSIPVGAVDIDSEWETGFNNFKFNAKYPNVTEMVERFHDQNIRVIFWITSMVDTDSDNYDDGEKNGYYIKDILGKAGQMKWWHGRGSLLDYTNHDAIRWWHAQMDKVLATGIDGWKCDGTDPYILELAGGAHGEGGHVSHRRYADDYYGDFLDHTRAYRGSEALIMSRPVDALGPVYLKFSPRRVMFSGWVGDADPSFSGLVDTLKRYLQSAWAGYANFGSDIGGYRHGNGTLGRTKELFIRWAQLGAFSPLMENGGNGEHRPWAFDANSTATPSIEDIYRSLVLTHYQLVPYLLTTGTLAYNENRSSLLPLAPHEDFIDKIIDDFRPPTYNYMLGADILVAPVTSHPASVNVTFPRVAGGNETFVAWWNRSLVYYVGQSVEFRELELHQFTAFLRTGVLFPLRPRWSSEVPFSNRVRSHWLQLHVYHPSATTEPRPVQVVDDSHGLVAAYWREPSGSVHVSCTSHPALSVSLHVHFAPHDTLSPCLSSSWRHRRRRLRICRRHGDAANGVCEGPVPVFHDDDIMDVGGAFNADPRFDAAAEARSSTSYGACRGGHHGDVVVVHGPVRQGAVISVELADL